MSEQLGVDTTDDDLDREIGKVERSVKLERWSEVFRSFQYNDYA